MPDCWKAGHRNDNVSSNIESVLLPSRQFLLPPLGVEQMIETESRWDAGYGGGVKFGSSCKL